MMRSRFTEEQIIGILKEHAAGLSATELCRMHGIRSEAHRPIPSLLEPIRRNMR